MQMLAILQRVCRWKVGPAKGLWRPQLIDAWVEIMACGPTQCSNYKAVLICRFGEFNFLRARNATTDMQLELTGL